MTSRAPYQPRLHSPRARRGSLPLSATFSLAQVAAPRRAEFAALRALWFAMQLLIIGGFDRRSHLIGGVGGCDRADRWGARPLVPGIVFASAGQLPASRGPAGFGLLLAGRLGSGRGPCWRGRPPQRSSREPLVVHLAAARRWRGARPASRSRGARAARADDCGPGRARISSAPPCPKSPAGARFPKPQPPDTMARTGRSGRTHRPPRGILTVSHPAGRSRLIRIDLRKRRSSGSLPCSVVDPDTPAARVAGRARLPRVALVGLASFRSPFAGASQRTVLHVVSVGAGEPPAPRLFGTPGSGWSGWSSTD